MNEPQPRPKRLRHYGRWLLLAILLTSAWGGWRVWDEKQAVKEAKALGWGWVSDEPVGGQRKDWNTAFRTATWMHGVRWLLLPSAEEYDQHRDLVHRLRPRQLMIYEASNWHDLSALKGLSTLDALLLDNCTGLTNVDALNRLPGLRFLSLAGCTKLANLAPLNGLPALQELGLNDCTGLTNVDLLKALPNLKYLTLTGCTGLSKETVDALKAALPVTTIDGP